jgi:hypothetical protein
MPAAHNMLLLLLLAAALASAGNCQQTATGDFGTRLDNDSKHTRVSSRNCDTKELECGLTSVTTTEETPTGT